MAMKDKGGGTMGQIANECPVCGERYDGNPDRCLKCRISLEKWWPLEAALREEAPERGGRWKSSVPTLTWQGRAMGFVLVGFALGLLLLPILPSNSPVPPSPILEAESPSPIPEENPPLPAPRSDPPDLSPATPTESRGMISYRVQNGDFLSGIALALTGDSARWRQLWPEYVGKEHKLISGTELPISIVIDAEGTRILFEEKGAESLPAEE